MTETRELIPSGEYTTILPASVRTCSYCKGHGQYSQWWCDAPRSPGACEVCGGAQWVYAGTGKGVPESVRQQIAAMNGFTEHFDGTSYLMLLRGFKVLAPPDAFPLADQGKRSSELEYGWKPS